MSIFSLMTYVLCLVFLLIVISFYFKIANHFKIIDRPNERSSHSYSTVRGGGIIFPLSLILQFGLSNYTYPFFIIGLVIISSISLVDDIKPLSNAKRLAAHLIAVSFMFIDANIWDCPLWIVPVIYLVVIGTINAYNFMDGINGITGGYSVVLIATLWYINSWQVKFIDENWLTLALIALIVFNIYNFRKVAKCFAGDVGSISIAFSIIFFLILLVEKTGDPKYILFLTIYGLDSVSTIIFRIIRKENIFKAHRSHFYQFLANEKKKPHILIASLYMVFQLILNIVILEFSIGLSGIVSFILISLLIFIMIRFRIQGQEWIFPDRIKKLNS